MREALLERRARAPRRRALRAAERAGRARAAVARAPCGDVVGVGRRDDAVAHRSAAREREVERRAARRRRRMASAPSTPRRPATASAASSRRERRGRARRACRDRRRSAPRSIRPTMRMRIAQRARREHAGVEQAVVGANLRSERDAVAEHRAEVGDHHRGRAALVHLAVDDETRRRKNCRRSTERSAAREPMIVYASTPKRRFSQPGVSATIAASIPTPAAMAKRRPDANRPRSMSCSSPSSSAVDAPSAPTAESRARARADCRCRRRARRSAHPCPRARRRSPSPCRRRRARRSRRSAARDATRARRRGPGAR